MDSDQIKKSVDGFNKLSKVFSSEVQRDNLDIFELIALGNLLSSLIYNLVWVGYIPEESIENSNLSEYSFSIEINNQENAKN